MVKRLAPYASVFLRVTLGVGFFSAVLDRFGFWGAPGATNVAWGDFGRFTAYTATLNPWASDWLVSILAWLATAGEVVLGTALLLGLFVRPAALASGLLLLLFALGMTVGTGFKTALDASVLTAAAGAFSLAVLGAGRWSVDAWRSGRGGVSRGSASISHTNSGEDNS